MRQLARMEIDLREINHIFITHFHIDHFNDLPAIIFAMKNGLSDGRGDLTIHGPQGFTENFQAIRHAYGSQIVTDKFRTSVVEHGEDEFQIDSVKVRTIQMAHSVPAIGYRFDGTNGKSLTYSGDTEPCSNIIKLAMGGEGLLMECSQPDDAPMPGHATTSQAAAVAQKAEVKTLILTHISPQNDTTNLEQNAAQFFNGIVIAARDGMRLTI